MKIKKPSTVKYDGYNKTKAKRIIRRKFRKNALKANERLVIDFIPFITNLKGFDILMLIIDRYFSFARKLFIKRNKFINIIIKFKYFYAFLKYRII